MHTAPTAPGCLLKIQPHRARAGSGSSPPSLPASRTGPVSCCASNSPYLTFYNPYRVSLSPGAAAEVPPPSTGAVADGGGGSAVHVIQAYDAYDMPMVGLFNCILVPYTKWGDQRSSAGAILTWPFAETMAALGEADAELLPLGGGAPAAAAGGATVSGYGM